jgi:hypothetical protein
MQNTLETLYTYWNGVRAGRLAPRRLEIEPASIAPLLADTFMLERVHDDSFQYRLAGTHVCDTFGGELRGQGFLQDFHENDRAALGRAIRDLTDRGAVVRLATLGISDARHTLDIETILLPLAHAGDSISRILGASIPTSRPPWLGHYKIKKLRLINHDLVWPDGRPYQVVARAMAPQPFMRSDNVVRIFRNEKRTFRLLQGGRSDSE